MPTSALFLPVLTDDLFDPGLMTECLLRNIFLVGIPQRGCTAHQLNLTPLGQLIHDLAHSFIGIYQQRELLQQDYSWLFKHFPSAQAGFELQKKLEQDTTTLWNTKSAALRHALLQAHQHIAQTENKPAMVGFFCMMHEFGIPGYISPREIGDLTQNVVTLFKKAEQRIKHYCANTSQTSPKDGQPIWGAQHMPDALREQLPEGAAVRVTPQGVVLTIEWKKGSQAGSHVMKTQKWITQEMVDMQGLLAWAKIDDPAFVRPQPPSADDAPEVYQEYNRATQEGILFCLEEAQKSVLDYLMGDAGQKTRGAFQQAIDSARQVYYQQHSSPDDLRAFCSLAL
jgi:hypothetical protein